MKYVVTEQQLKAAAYDRILEIIREGHNSDADAVVEIIAELASRERQIQEITNNSRKLVRRKIA